MQVKDFKDKHLDKIGFVVGAGPSLHFQDVSRLKDHVTFAVNSSLLKIPFCNYFVSDDWAVSEWNYYSIELPKLPCTSFLYKSKLQNLASHLNQDKVVWFNHKTWYDLYSNKYYEDGLVLTKDEPIIGARTSMGSAVHLAYIMGCNPIVLLGCDSCFHERKRYYWQFPNEPKVYKLNHAPVNSFPNKGVIKGKQVDQHSVEFIAYWKALAEQANKQGIKIIDASNGILDCFEKKTLEEVLNG